MTENPLQLLMNPKSIAVVGANNDSDQNGNYTGTEYCERRLPRQAFYPIHLTEKTVLGTTRLMPRC